jgi:hypothetical protein
LEVWRRRKGPSLIRLYPPSVKATCDGSWPKSATITFTHTQPCRCESQGVHHNKTHDCISSQLALTCKWEGIEDGADRSKGRWVPHPPPHGYSRDRTCNHHPFCLHWHMRGEELKAHVADRMAGGPLGLSVTCLN